MEAENFAFALVLWTIFGEARLFELAHALVYLGDFFGACLAFLLSCYCVLCIFTVFNVVCIYVELLFLSLYAFGFYFWPIFFWLEKFAKYNAFFFSPGRFSFF